MTTSERVRRGAEALDNYFGKDWPGYIATEYLDLSDGSYCVLGQLFEPEIDDYVAHNPDTTACCGYEVGYDLLGFAHERDAEAHGFQGMGTGSDCAADVQDLEHQWAALIEARLAA